MATLSAPSRPSRNPPQTSFQHEKDVFDDSTFPQTANEDDVDREVEDEDEEDTFEDAEQFHRHRQEEMYGGPTDFRNLSRSYDDEDAALQAALKASMADVPAGWAPPKLESNKPRASERKVSAPPPPAPVPVPAPVPELGTPEKNTNHGSKFVEDMEEDDDGPAESLSPGELPPA